MSFSIILAALRPHLNSEGVDFIIKINGDRDVEERSLTLPEGSYLEWRSRVGGEITSAEYDTLESEAQYYNAFLKGVNLLEYGDMSTAALVRKLRARGYAAPSAARAAEHLTKLGVLNETQLARRTVRFYIEKKNYGYSRIISEMYAKGFTRENVDAALGEIDKESFIAACRAMIARKFGDRLPTEPDARRRATAALYRYGFTRAEINAAEK